MESAIVWMGGVTAEMDTAFITEAFANVGYTVIGVKEIIKKNTGERANYCFVDFGDVNIAREVLIKIHNQPIPGTKTSKFRLNRSEFGRSSGGSTEYSLFVGDLSPEVNDDMLLDFFRKKYSSVRAAKVVYDERGMAKGYGFVRFYNEQQHELSLTEMQGATGLGERAIRVNKAVKGKNRDGSGDSTPAAAGGIDPAMLPSFMQMQMHYMTQMQSYMEQCHQYAQQAAVSAGWLPDTSTAPQVPSTPASSDGSVLNYIQQQHDQLVAQTPEMPENEDLVDPNPPVDVTALNQAIIDLDDKLFFEMENSRWDPDFAVLGVREQRPIKARCIVVK